MHICFIEDTQLRGGTQIWVSEAVRVLLAAGHDVTVLTAADGFNARRLRDDRCTGGDLRLRRRHGRGC